MNLFQEVSDFVAPNRIRKGAGNKPVVIVPLLLCSDDLSSNRTRKWNCLNAWSVLLAGLPKHLNTQLITFIFSVPPTRFPPLDMLEPITEDLIVLQNGVDMYDALLCCNVMVCAPVLACLCDNPRTSEIVGHLRGNPNAFCRQCLVCMMYLCLPFLCVCSVTRTEIQVLLDL